MNKYMKQTKFDFFESPHPHNLDFNNFRRHHIYGHEDQDLHNDPLFNLPTKPNNLIGESPRIDIDPYFTCEVTSFKVKKVGDCDQELDAEMNAESQEISYQPEINYILDYSQQQQLLIPLTPQKQQFIDEKQQATTARKINNILATPLSQAKYFQKGLKKLAFQAFQFVSHQKRTTYKQVAKRLITQINDENEFDVHKKGEMNIKRRVYDALNVLIALGLLKRNGNKILGKKAESDSIFFQKQFTTENLKRKEEMLQDELLTLRNQYSKKITTIDQKKKIFEQLKLKSEGIKNLTLKNQKAIESKQISLVQTLHHQKNSLQFPFIVIGYGCKQEDHQNRVKYSASTNSYVSITQESRQNLKCYFNSVNNIEIISDLDLIKHFQQDFPGLDRVQRLKRSKKG